MRVLLLPLLLLVALTVTTAAQTIKDGDKITNWTYLAFGENDVVRAYIAPESVQRGENRIRPVVSR